MVPRRLVRQRGTSRPRVVPQDQLRPDTRGVAEGVRGVLCHRRGTRRRLPGQAGRTEADPSTRRAPPSRFAAPRRAPHPGEPVGVPAPPRRRALVGALKPYETSGFKKKEGYEKKVLQFLQVMRIFRGMKNATRAAVTAKLAAQGLRLASQDESGWYVPVYVETVDGVFSGRVWATN